MKGPSKLQIILLHVGLTVVCFATLYPVLWVVKMALSPTQALSLTISPIPEAVTLDHFREVLFSSDAQGRWLFGRQLLSSLVVSGATTGSDPPADLSRLFWRQLSVIGSSMGTREELAALCALLQQTGARPVIDSEWPLERAPEAYDRLLSDHLFGMVVVIP